MPAAVLRLRRRLLMAESSSATRMALSIYFRSQEKFKENNHKGTKVTKRNVGDCSVDRSS